MTLLEHRRRILKYPLKSVIYCERRGGASEVGAACGAAQTEEEQPVAERYERGELLLYKATVLREGGKFVKALALLNDSEVVAPALKDGFQCCADYG